jgi:hypothetical protein
VQFGKHAPEVPVLDVPEVFDVFESLVLSLLPLLLVVPESVPFVCPVVLALVPEVAALVLLVLLVLLTEPVLPLLPGEPEVLDEGPPAPMPTPKVPLPPELLLSLLVPVELVAGELLQPHAPNANNSADMSPTNV